MPKSHEVLELLAKIPKGKVTTYGDLSKAANSSPRAVGQIMRNNRNPVKYPCYKVVKSSGEIGGYCGATSGGMISRKIALLRKDNIEVSNGRIDLRKFGYSFKGEVS